ncbi:MAG TPA: SCO family protein [Vicinamibacterales bacterium]|nr:SCO family protein [Vicinamibacterales bacterium]
MYRKACFLTILSILSVACSGSGHTAPPPRQYQLQGQILAVTPARNEVVIRAGDIPGFMPAMTMTYKVGDASLLSGKQPGDLVNGTLVVGEVDAHLSALTKTGHSEIKGPLPLAAEIIQPKDPVPDATFIDQDGKSITFSSLEGHRVALTFAYTRCPLPDYCPLMNHNFAEIQNTVEKTPALSDVKLLTVSVDPEYDTPAVLKKYGRLYHEDPDRWMFLTGDLAQVKKFAAAFGISMEKDPNTPGQVVHNLRTAVVDADGRLVTVTSGNDWRPSDIVAELEKTPAPAH